MGTTGPASDQPGDRRALCPRPPGDHHPRHGARAGDAARPSRHRDAVLASSAARWAGCRCCSGRRPIPSASFARAADRRRARGTRRRTSPSTRSAARRSWPIPNWRGGDYLPRRQRAREKGLAVARMAAHITYLSDDGAAPEVRPQPAGPREADLRLRRRLPDRELSPPPGDDLRRPLRRQLLPLHHPGDGLFRPRRRARRPARQRLQGHADALLRRLLHHRLALPDRREQGGRARAQRRRRAASASSRSRPTAATTPSCSTSRSCSPPSAASSRPPRTPAASG